MVITGVSLDKSGNPTKFRVEHSLSDDETCLIMTKQWFEEFGLQIVVDQKLVSDSVMKVFSSNPQSLLPWDPLGKLSL
jgi:bleomycin hydrolase